MDHERRAALMAQLTEAQAGEATAREQLESLAANIEQLRITLGSPYFYSNRPNDDPKSEANFTGYASHDPALRLLEEWRQARQQIVAIQLKLSS